MTISSSFVGMAKTSQTTYRRALARGNLSSAQRRVARRSLRLQQAIETLEGIAAARAAGSRPGLRDVPALAGAGAALGEYVLAHPRRWRTWAGQLRNGRRALWRAGPAS